MGGGPTAMRSLYHLGGLRSVMELGFCDWDLGLLVSCCAVIC